MSLYPFFRPRHLSLVGEMMRDFARMERQFVPLTSSVSEIVDNHQKFAVNLDVSQFKPEELKINLDGRKLSIEGEQEVKSENGCSKRSFSRVIVLPEDVDVGAFVSNLSNEGNLCIEAPKKEAQGRSIPIQHSVQEKTDEKI